MFLRPYGTGTSATQNLYNPIPIPRKNDEMPGNTHRERSMATIG